MIRGTLGCLDICVEKDSNGPRLDTTSLISQVILSTQSGLKEHACLWDLMIQESKCTQIMHS